MSFLWKPVSGGGGIAGTAVDPLGPGGVLIEIPTEVLQVPGPPLPAGHVLQADGLGGFVMGPQGASGASTFAIQYSHDGGVPSFGTRYLRFGQGVISSVAGFRMSAAGKLRAVTVQVGNVDANTYDVEILVDPAARLGAPTVLTTLTLSPGTLFTLSAPLLLAVASGDELGARMVLTAGSGASAFFHIVVNTEWSIP